MFLWGGGGEGWGSPISWKLLAEERKEGGQACVLHCPTSGALPGICYPLTLDGLFSVTSQVTGMRNFSCVLLTTHSPLYKALWCG